MVADVLPPAEIIPDRLLCSWQLMLVGAPVLGAALHDTLARCSMFVVAFNTCIECTEPTAIGCRALGMPLKKFPLIGGS